MLHKIISCEQILLVNKNRNGVGMTAHDSDSIRIRFEFRDYHVTLHKFPKKEIFVFAKIESCVTQGRTNFQKRKFVLPIVRFDSNSIQIRSIRIRFGFDSIQTESNFINSDSICRSRIQIESESESESDSIRRIVCRTLIIDDH